MSLRTCYLLLLSLLTLATISFPVGQRELFSLVNDAPAQPQRLTVLGYEREEFGAGWSTGRSGCTTRDELLAQAYGAALCSSVTDAEAEFASVVDPYTGEPLELADVEIDHVFPLSAAWDLGAHRWDAASREEFANDPRNLIVTSRQANQSKSDQLPSQWLPPDPSYRCEYITHLARVAAHYKLALPEADRQAMRKHCRVSLVGFLSERLPLQRQ
ncbi:HNH endonuclease family protein [Corynebacterium lubricantis]|uniref:HNH endonuclease family protein n=1 Tax=Corynebacterium lubricantis TaxID=541095 RepID=UPI00039B0456|nr:HNH endonuclease family protein [Corynebacterium lubricantis]